MRRTLAEAQTLSSHGSVFARASRRLKPERRQLDHRVVQRRGARRQVELLRDKADVVAAVGGALARREATDVAPVEEDAARVGREQRRGTACSSVLLPDPLGPYRATNSPACDPSA